MAFDRRELLRAGALLAVSGAGGLAGWKMERAWAAEDAAFPDEVLNPVEVSGADAVPVIGRLPGQQRMYMLPDGMGEHHLIGSQRMTRIATPRETANSYELATFAGSAGNAMPRHRHLASHAAMLIMEGEVELELDGNRWRMMRGDFANIPPGTPHAWTLRSDRARFALFTMGDRVGTAFAGMGTPTDGSAVNTARAISPDKLAAAAMAGDFQLVAEPAPASEPQRTSNLLLPATPGPYVLLDGGGERFGGNTFCAKNQNTGGQFLFIMTEGGAGPGIGAHFHARHTEDFFALDGETLGWANGRAVSLKPGDFFQAPPRHLHGFKMTQSYNRFVGFLTPGIFEKFFTRGQPGRNGIGGRTAGERAPAQERPPAPPGTGAPSAAPGNRGDIFRLLAMSGRGPDGYPLDVHGAKLPLPPQDPVWVAQRVGALEERRLLLQHALMCSGRGDPAAAITPELRRALAFKQRAEDFV